MHNSIHWQPIMALGIDFMDAEHHAMIEGVTALATAFDGGRVDAARSAFDAVLAQAESHFANEELAMRQHRMAQPDYIAHKVEHDDFLIQLRFFRDRLGRCDGKLHGDILEFISAWLVSHMLGQDRRLSLQMTARAA